MAGGVYSALSGIQVRMDRLDRLSQDIGNSGTVGYKSERNTNIAVERPNFSDVLASAVDVLPAARSSDLSPGLLTTTGRDLDVAIEGDGFFAIQAPGGPRYTRNGHFTRQPDGVLTMGGAPVLGQDGPITLPPGQVAIGADGTIKVGGEEIGQLAVFRFDDPSKLVREDGVRFRAPQGMVAIDVDDPALKSGALEQANVSLPTRMAQLTEVARSFEALQRGMSVLMNDIDGRAISELGRR